MQRQFDALAAAGARGVHVGVDPANTGAVAFKICVLVSTAKSKPECEWHVPHVIRVAVGMSFEGTNLF